MNLTLGMGADHVKPEKLKQIVAQINADRPTINNPSAKASDTAIYLYQVYGISVSPFDMAQYVMQRYVIEEKYDGFSYLNCEGKFFSKSLSSAKGNEGQPIEKSGHLPLLSQILKCAYERCGCDLHGELYILGGISDDMSRFMGCLEDEAIRRQKEAFRKLGPDGVPHYMLIDIRAYNGRSLVNEPYYIRRMILEYIYHKFIVPNDMYNLVRLTEIINDDPRVAFRRIVRAGGEGIIMKRTDALYIPGKKPTDNWVKGKKKITLDVVIMGFNDGTGKNKELFGSFGFGLYIDGKLTPCGSCSSGLSDTIRQQVAANPESYIGTVMEITAIQESVKSFRNAVFLKLRDDKTAEECTPLGIMLNDNLVEE
jgi:ATP-dependent DNA ligase